MVLLLPHAPAAGFEPATSAREKDAVTMARQVFTCLKCSMNCNCHLKHFAEHKVPDNAVKNVKKYFRL
jgi:hypothetical protein